MRTTLDSNILSALWSNEPGAAQVAEMLREAGQTGHLILSPIAYIELLAHPKSNEQFLSKFLQESSILVDYDLSASIWTEAGRRFARYASRRRQSGGGETRRLAADFVVGAHALLRSDRLMSLDIGYRRVFPELTLLVPGEQQ